MSFDLYQAITDRIIAELESGIIPWERPWTGTSDGAISYGTGKPYSLLNQFLLREPGEYITLNEINRLGGKLKKGSKARIIVFWRILQSTKKDADGNVVRDSEGMPVPVSYPVLRYHNVFHLDDTIEIEPKHKSDAPVNYIHPVEKAETTLNSFLSREHIQMRNVRGNRAFYNPTTDSITLPLMEQFVSAEEYYSTAFHECVHSTGHPRRLKRISSTQFSGFGSEEYSKEELVAEIGSCALMHQLKLETTQTFRNTSAYIQSWLRALRNDKRLIVNAAGQAEKAVNLIVDKCEK